MAAHDFCLASTAPLRSQRPSIHHAIFTSEMERALVPYLFDRLSQSSYGFTTFEHIKCGTGQECGGIPIEA